ncbi:FAD/NAD(P)-binding protein [Streptomyces litchfieldiae]|uniref:FAD/NAD(P)-binding protein n=1 Tax=Streptomyces litchfieldiae TaxID=3075543 RepID=A0ABU2MWP7_9ACTN|nr:FAD/NAD(P)-binding protein [Streptomyces sp. DSM 44938]MDT0345792.1 FAD/NAD(P)-binding protein [Streptomyces sp. DSM 44938]
MSGCVEVCIVGGGPRGLSVLERLCANERHTPSGSAVIVHLVDPAPPGAGRVWRADQSRHLLMNTVTSQVSIFTDPSARIDGPIEPGPSLYEWARQLALLGPLGGRGDYSEETLAEARALGPDSYPTRALYGHYLNDCFRRIVADAPPQVKVHVHRSRAVAMADTHGVTGGPQGVRLEDGTRLNNLDAIVLAQGHVPARLTPRQERTAALARIHYLTYITPVNPAEADLDPIAPGTPVLLRGLGLNFFDYLALFTHGRGGTFSREADGRLRYHPSGREPRLFASSRRGVPYHARGENEKGPHGRYHPRLLTVEHIARLRQRAEDGERVRFTTDLWPLIRAEVESVYYATLLTARGRKADAESLAERYLELAPTGEVGELLDSFGIPRAERWDWERISQPCVGQNFTDRDAFRAWLLDYLARDVREARAGNISGPLKAALDVLRDLRNEIRLAVDHGGLEGNSHRDDLEGWYTPLNAFLSIGPPVTRIEEMIAVIEAGVLELTGPGTKITFDAADPAFVAESEAVPGPPVRARALIEARLPEPDLRRTEDPLLRHLLATEQAGPYRIPGECGTSYETGGLAVSERPYHLLDARGRAHPRRFAFGVPTESVHWVTAAGIRPGVDSVTLGDSDAIARAALSLPPVAHVPSQVRPASDDTDLTGVIV